MFICCCRETRFIADPTVTMGMPTIPSAGKGALSASAGGLMGVGGRPWGEGQSGEVGGDHLEGFGALILRSAAAQGTGAELLVGGVAAATLASGGELFDLLCF